jgi:hypothetical protein
MVPLASLWLPTLLAAAFVFLASSILHMALTYHRSDYRQLPRESERLAALGGSDLAPGLYSFPFCASPKEMKGPEMRARFDRGPVGLLIAYPNGPVRMGKYLGGWFVYLLVVSFFVAYLAAHTLSPGARYLEVFRVVGAAAFLAYGLGRVVDSIWMGVPWSNTLRGVVDGLLYALVTAGTFGWLWPH